ncbi:MAG TPA: ATP-binding protein [bacterium]|nr:ATP-binding protein [bacterium]HPN42594.1 ATP-binding protein [bacterium]
MKPYLYPEEKINNKTVPDRTIIMALVFIFGSLILLFSILEIREGKKELLHVMTEQSQAMMMALQKGTENAVTSFNLVEDLLAEKLLSNARLIERLDYEKKLNRQDIDEIARENNIFRINVFDAKGNRILSNAPGLGLGRGNRNAGNSQEHLLELLNDKDNDELVIGFRASRFGIGDRFAVAKRRRNGGAIILNTDASEMLEFRKTIGAGKLVKDIGENEGIEYVVLQDSAGILLASQGVDSLLSPQNDSFIMNKVWSDQTLHTRFTSFNDQKIFELLQCVSSEAGKKEIWRIGLDTHNLQHLQNRAQMRTILAAILFLVTGVIISTRVISKQNYKKLEETLETMESYTGNILANMSEAVIAIDGAGRVTIFNNAAEKLFHLEMSQVLGNPCQNILSPICPLFESLLANRNNYHNPALKVIIGNNDERILAIDITVLQKDTPVMLTVFAVIKDITEQKKLEENLARKDQITAMGHLASGVAHEIRNPLNAISMIAQRFKTEFEPVNDRDEFMQLAGTVVNETLRINTIVEQFLQFAKPQPLLKSKVDINTLIDEVVILTRQQANSKGVLIEKSCPVLPPLYADGNKLKQVLLNLVLNSIQACSKENQIQIICEQVEQRLNIHVKDNGKGIPPEIIDKIFNIYFTTREDGTGIGLSLVQQFVSLHNGIINVTSEPGRGTTFSIQLPIEE